MLKFQGKKYSSSDDSDAYACSQNPDRSPSSVSVETIFEVVAGQKVYISFKR